MSDQCHYDVTTCNDTSAALSLLKEKKDSFDVVITDVHKPNTDGYKLLQSIDQEFNILDARMSMDGLSSSVMEGIRHGGACHNLTKPIHQGDIYNIWQDADRKNTQNHHHHDNVLPTKKPRFVWTHECHQQFIHAVVQLGNKAKPKKILELMNIPGLTRENVASHLQKFRLNMKRKSDATKHQNWNAQSNNNLEASKRLSMQVVANGDARRNVSPQKQAAGLHAADGAITSESPNNNYPYGLLMAVDDASSPPEFDGWEWPSATEPCRFLQHQSGELADILAINQQQQLHQQILMPKYQNQNLHYNEHETFQDEINPVSAVNYYDNINCSFVDGDYFVLAELYDHVVPQVLASHTHQQQQLLQLDDDVAVRQFHGLPQVSDAVAFPYGFDSSLHHHLQGLVEIYNHGDAEVEHPI